MLERLILIVERIAAAFLVVVTVLTFVSVILRYLFAWGFPDAYDITENLLGIVIFWGVAIAGYRGEHITVDLLWTPLSDLWKRVLDVFAAAFSLGCMVLFTWAMATKVASTYESGVTTIDLHVPIWPYYFVAWAGILSATLLLVLRLIRVARAPLAVAPD